MWLTNIKWGIWLMLIITTMSRGQEDSLQSALNAVDRRQRDLTEIPDFKNSYTERGLATYYAPEDNGYLAFLKPENDDGDRKSLAKVLIKYLKNEGKLDSDQSKKENLKNHVSSSFRERIEKDQEKQKEVLANILLNKLQNDPKFYDDKQRFLNIVQELYEKHHNPYSRRIYVSTEINKRAFPFDYYADLGYNSAGMKKRNQNSMNEVNEVNEINEINERGESSEPLYLLDHTPKDDIFDKFQNEDTDEINTDYYIYNKQLEEDTKRDKTYDRPYSLSKQFSVRKRSSFSTPLNNNIYQHKHSSIRSTRNLAETDPKVVQELSNVFGIHKTKLDINDKPKKSKQRNNEQIIIADRISSLLNKSFNASDNMTQRDLDTTKSNNNNKEVSFNSLKNAQLQLQKKSIDWSDYFGYDRKKKSSNRIDNEWLLEHYHKAIAMATKRSAEYPMTTFANQENKSDRLSENSERYSDEDKLKDIDSKLKSVEDSIVDETLKYTGAHEETVDSKEMQKVKDKVISKLVTAYNLEKMRQALNKYKSSIAKQKEKLKEELSDSSFLEEKRVSVPRKQAINEEREKIIKADNNIKCTDNNEDCEEQNYKVPNDILDEQYGFNEDDCPKIQRVCETIAKVLGGYGRILLPACYMHQACLLCGDNSWFAPTRQCNFLFLAKTDQLCNGDVECQGIANYSVRYLADINPSLRVESLDECNLMCPDNRP